VHDSKGALVPMLFIMSTFVIACLSHPMFHASSPLAVSAFAMHRTLHVRPASFVTTGAAFFSSGDGNDSRSHADQYRYRSRGTRRIYAVLPKNAEPTNRNEAEDQQVFFAEEADLLDELNDMTGAKGSEQNGASMNKEDERQQGISSVDARVLQSILEDGKLDLSRESEVKRLLKGPRKEQKSSEEEEGKYSSKFVSTISDNSFWNSLKAKAGDVIDSVQIYIENRIEADSKLLASVGIYAMERIKLDVSRALPAAGKQAKKLARTALLSSNSSYAEGILNDPLGKALLLPPERSDMDDNALYEDLSTPADEIKKVTESIRDILSGKEVTIGQRSVGAKFDSKNRGLRSLAPAGTSRVAERQRRAYQARKETVLKREKEGIDQKFGRTLGSVSDMGWEMKKEMQAERNKPGYRSKSVRAALADASVKFLEASRDPGKWLKEAAKKEPKTKQLGGSASSGAQILDVSTQEEILEVDVEYASEGILGTKDFTEERDRFIASLDFCLSRPGETWLTKKVVADASKGGKNLDGEVLREVITTMVVSRDELLLVIDTEEESVELKIEYIKGELRRMKKMAASVSSLAVRAAGQGAADLLKAELEGFLLTDSLEEIVEVEMTRLKQRNVEIPTTESWDNYRATYDGDQVEATVVNEVSEDDSSAWWQAKKKVKNTQYTEVEVVAIYDESGEGMATEVSIPSSDSNVEVVSDEEYSDYEQKFKVAENAIEDDAEDEKENPAGELALRAVDAAFFVGEKVLLVGVPNVISTGAKATSRYKQAKNRGAGSKGWKVLGNINKKKRF